MKTFSTGKTVLRLGLFLLLLLGSSNSLRAQAIVHGRVSTTSGEILPGVSVLIKGTAKGTTTDVEGNFTLSDVQSSDVLVFSFIGYSNQEVEVGNQTSIIVTLPPDVKTLGEIVVVGYGTQRKIETTGSIISVKAEELMQTPVVNVAQGLQARAAGVQITQNSAAPGGSISVRVRGTNSINGTSEPLYVIDGIQISNGASNSGVSSAGSANDSGSKDLSPLSTINPGDIESIEVLKDASATAIYGSRGANGVVLITTKRGKAGSTRITYETYYGMQKVRKTMALMNAAEFAQLENDVFKTKVYSDPASLGQGTDWQSLIFREAPMQNHQLSISGGSEKTQLSLSLNYFNQDGIIVNSNFKRYSLRTSFDHRVSNHLKIGTNIMGSYNINSAVPTGSGGDGNSDVLNGVLGAAMAAGPTLKPYRDDGSIYNFSDQLDGRYREVVNPLARLAVLNKSNINRVLANVYGEANVVTGLTYRASFNADLQNSLTNGYTPRYTIAFVDQNPSSGSGSKTWSNTLTLLHESILTYSKTLAENHTVKFTGVFATQTTAFQTNAVTANGFPNDATTNENLGLALTVATTSNRTKERLDSYMGRINYGYKDKIFFDVTARTDGSSKFGANNHYGFFPAASVAWRLSEESFMKAATFVSDLKLRGSYGLTGNAGAISPYKSLPLLVTGSNYQINHAYQKGISPAGIVNPDLRWEKSLQADIGIDASLFQDRLELTVDVYKKTTRDLLYDMALPLSSGYKFITTNLGAIENKGLELAATAHLTPGAVKWNISANATFNRNKVLDIDGQTQERFVTPYSVIKVGQPLGLFKTYIFNGIYQTGEPVLAGPDGGRTGGAKILDSNKDGAISADDQVISGNPNPKFIYGFSSNVSFRKFDFNVFFSGSYGNDIYNFTRYSYENPNGLRNQFAYVVNHWSETNPSNELSGPLQGGRQPITDKFIEDGSYLRCKNITLGYTLPAIKGVSNIRVYVSANNLFTVTNYSGFDPEVNSFGNSNVAIGVDNFTYPTAKSYLAGIQVSF
ncbi:SusC/RagA family TonB-linked outer membrane protein [Chryseolinea lacunae]|uniref:TonB-dependent receptor n=1 Tax=Chryseolinea lacunae TaxID=2801331 RepID=A0ABS1L2G4_9BACT|nr:TonB-dependent receptor [Chryseolinea lacunae]MBL0745775.1 TonB-dependent receptor [Chryseolinea lacunae]